MMQKPWEINPDLTKERISAIANIIASVRGEVIDLHDEELGDTPLSLGTRAYECSRTKIIDLAGKSMLPWLKVITPEGRFTFSIGNTPVRFTRNDPNKLPNRKMIRSVEAMRQLSLFDDLPHAEIRWFIVFDTHYSRPADSVFCVGYDNSKRIAAQWEVPIEGATPVMSLVKDGLPQPVDVKEASVALKVKSTLKIAK